MAKYELKTKDTGNSPDKFLKSIKDKKQREDSIRIIEMMKKVTKEEPRMWGTSMIGFGTYHYKYASGHEGDFFIVGFSPRKLNLTLYILCRCGDEPELLKKLGKFKMSKSCLYIRSLDDIDLKVLEKLVSSSYKEMKKKY